jgi:hypothetical protein
MHSRTSREQWKYCNRHLRVLIVALAVASTPPLFRTHRCSLRKPSHVVKLADSDFAPTKVASTLRTLTTSRTSTAYRTCSEASYAHCLTMFAMRNTPNEPTSYSKREQIVIETKMTTRTNLGQRGVTEELAIDQEVYRSHPDFERASSASKATRPAHVEIHTSHPRKEPSPRHAHD